MDPDPDIRAEIETSAKPPGRPEFPVVGIGASAGGLKALQELIFNKTEEYSGTGIGRAIVARSMKRMGGPVGVESGLAKGSRFRVEFPEMVAEKFV